MKLFLRLLMVALVGIGAGCSDDVATAPTDKPQFTSNDEKLQRLARYHAGPMQITIAFAAKTIGPAGGSISILGFEAVVPPGAVSKNTRFTIRLPIDPNDSEFVRAEFGPHGQTFDVPITLRLPLKGTTSDWNTGARVMWWNGTSWIPFETVPTNDGRIEARTNHFSEYGTEGDTQKGIILGGGS